MSQRQFHVRKEDLRSLSPSAAANLFWGLVKTEAAFAEDFDRECLEAVAADMGPKLLSFSPRVSEVKLKRFLQVRRPGQVAKID